MTASTDAWLTKGDFFTHRGNRIFWRQEGPLSAPVLVLIHGFPTASWDWERIWPQLAARYRVLTLDMIGFGFSAKPYFYQYSLLDQADTFEQLLGQQKVEHYHLLAHDYGVSVAQELIARQSDYRKSPKLHSIAFLNGGLFPESHGKLSLENLLLSPLGPLIAPLMNKSALASNLRKVFGSASPPTAQTIDSMWDLMAVNHGPRIMHKVMNYLNERATYRERWVGALQATALPLKLIDGLVDPISGRGMAERYRELVPHADITELRGIGHYPQVQAPEAVLESYLSFRGSV